MLNEILDVLDGGPSSYSDWSLASLLVSNIANKEFKIGSSRRGLLTGQGLVHRNHDVGFAAAVCSTTTVVVRLLFKGDGISLPAGPPEGGPRRGVATPGMTP